jgi:hypothetical protein
MAVAGLYYEVTMVARKQKADQNGQPTESGRPPDLSIADVHRQFGGKWVLVKTTKVDERGEPRRGVVIAAGSHSKVYKTLASQIELYGRPEFPYDVFLAGDWVLFDGKFPGEDEPSQEAAAQS